MREDPTGDPNLKGDSGAEAFSSPEAIDLLRRKILTTLLASGAMTALLSYTDLIGKALAQTPDLTHDTLNGVVAFFVPGPDPYSMHQGESTPEPGGLQAGAGVGLFQGLNFAYAFMPSLADSVAGLLNQTAMAVNPKVSGPFQSAFSNLSFADKGKVFGALEGNPEAAPIAGILPVIVGFLSYAETAVFNPATRTISGRPIGWDLSHYPGVADGQNDFKGYFKGRRQAV